MNKKDKKMRVFRLTNDEFHLLNMIGSGNATQGIRIMLKEALGYKTYMSLSSQVTLKDIEDLEDLDIAITVEGMDN